MDGAFLRDLDQAPPLFCRERAIEVERALDLIDCTLRLEFVASPERAVYQVAGRLTFFHESSCVKHAMVCLKPQMPIRLPAPVRARTVPDETRVALSCGHQQHRSLAD